MEEITIQWIAFLKLINAAIFAVLYGFGGISGKWKRRFVAPFGILLPGMVGFGIWEQTFSWWFVLSCCLLCASLCIGYGGTTINEKIWKRSRVGLAVGCSAIPTAIVTNNYILLAFHIFLCILFSVLLGVVNPTDARHEETAMGFIFVFPLLYMI